jgi:hypothetical protein
MQGVTGPTGRFNHAMCRDSQGRQVLLFGGRRTARGVAEDPTLWSWSDRGWRALATTGPAPRSSPVLACDDRGRAIVFGGYGQTELGDTWEWNGDHWRLHDSVGGPPASHSAGAIDPEEGSLIVFGGFRGEGADAPTAETWEWNGTRWRRLHVPGPPARYAHAMVSDPVNGRILLFGGNSGFGAQSRMLTDTWEWDGGVWRQIGTTGPEVFADRAMASDPATGAIWLVGGRADLRPELQMWRLAGSQWTPVATAGAPATRAGVAATAAPDGNGILVLGGLTDQAAAASDELYRVTNSAWAKLSGTAP